MPPVAKMKKHTDVIEYDRYMKAYVYAKNKLVYCVLCNSSCPLKDYPSHCETQHDINPKEKCSYCLGEYSWPRWQKNKHGQHLLSCMKELIKRSKNTTNEENNDANDVAMAVESSARPSRVVASVMMCRPCHEFYSKSKVEQRIPYMPTWPLQASSFIGSIYEFETTYHQEIPKWLELEDSETIWENVRFGGDRRISWKALLIDPSLFDKETHLSEAASWLSIFQRYHLEHKFYHGMIRAGVFESFMSALMEKESLICIIPFSCMCDGVNSNQRNSSDYYKQHRHILFVVNRSFQIQAYLRRSQLIFPMDCMVPGGKKYYLKQIKTAYHMVNALVYVSRPNSRCCSWKDEENERVRTILTSEVVINRERFYFPDEELPEEIENEIDLPIPTGARGHYCISKPMAFHDAWKLALMVPGGLDELARFRFQKVGDIDTKTKVGCKWYAPVTELSVTNCPIYLSKGLEIGKTPMSDIRDGAFVFWFNGKILPVVKTNAMEFEDKKEYAIQCVSTQTNILLNLIPEETFLIKKGSFNKCVSSFTIRSNDMMWK